MARAGGAHGDTAVGRPRTPTVPAGELRQVIPHQQKDRRRLGGPDAARHVAAPGMRTPDRGVPSKRPTRPLFVAVPLRDRLFGRNPRVRAPNDGL